MGNNEVKNDFLFYLGKKENVYKSCIFNDVFGVQ
jgi:hypothetical protein